MPIDYSKWKSIEVSDDEDDTHPNIHTPALFRLRHQSRLEKMAAMKEAREELESNKQESSTRLQEIEDKLKNASIAEKERTSLELEKQKINEEWEKYQQKERELEDKERLQPWNVDTIGHEAWSKTIVNKATERKEPPPAPAIDDEEDNRRMAQYFKDHEELIKQFAMLDQLDECENFLLEHPHLSSDYAASYITIEALNLAMLGKVWIGRT
ncbi:Hsp90 co-chaperone Cdc37 [Aphelenchoides avenae]|nr:Hsp90 co-chaperone Cdc37 [Aphelenchus avenae]